jgi:hypothetical protein
VVSPRKRESEFFRVAATRCELVDRMLATCWSYAVSGDGLQRIGDPCRKEYGSQFSFVVRGLGR